jgi:beta-mannosidase
MNKKQYLHEGWVFRACPGNSKQSHSEKLTAKYLKSYPAIVPGTIHTDLLRNKVINDPFFADNETALQWISDYDWEYTTVFIPDPAIDISKPVYLVFAGLDTLADIYINGTLIGNAANMFRKHEFRLNNLKRGKNQIRILFHSPVVYAKAQEEKYGALPVALRSERVYIRKAQYSFGWDWGPTFITSGIWKSVWLENRTEPTLDQVFFSTKELKKEGALCSLTAAVSGKLSKGYSALCELEIADKIVYSAEIPLSGTHSLNHEFILANPEVWYPNGSGEQPLYTLTVSLVKDEGVVSVVTKRVGIRTLSLQLRDTSGKTFRFIVNGQPVFMKGVDWIPSHSFLPEVKEQTYRTLLEKARYGNMNMVRVWGGGVYENDVFYDLCDELGLLVWQDFMFACAAYPEHPAFVAEVKKEVEDNILRLRSHASLALWCGNNENEWIWVQEQKSPYTNMPGHKIYSQVIPEIVNRLAPQQPYWISSPFGDGPDPNAMDSGNRHQWNVWSMWVDYEKVTSDNSRFVTEFGFQGPANRNTLERAIPAASRSVQSPLFEFHNKQVEGNERLIRFLAGHLPLKTEWNDFLYLTQLNQGFALKTCLEHWRANAPETNGALIWQLNDCWPVTSWSLIDSALMPKLSYYFVRRAFAPAQISFRQQEGSLQIVGANSTGEMVNGIIELHSLRSGAAKIEAKFKKKIRIGLSESVVLHEGIPAAPDMIYIATLRGEAGEIISRTHFTAAPWKYLKLPKSGLSAECCEKENERWLKISTKNPAFFVDIDAGGCTFSDRGFILLPGESVTLKVEGALRSIEKISLISLNDYL